MKQKNEAAKELGRLGGSKGGRARAAALTKKQRSFIARQAARKRWHLKSPDEYPMGDFLSDQFVDLLFSEVNRIGIGRVRSEINGMLSLVAEDLGVKDGKFNPDPMDAPSGEEGRGPARRVLTSPLGERR